MHTAFRGLIIFAVVSSIGAGVSMPASADLESQLRSAREANERNRDAAGRSRNAGRDSIGRGNRNMHHGRHHHKPPQVHMGAVQVAQGLLGLLASAVADKLANKDSTIAGNLDAIPSGTGGALLSASAAQTKAAGDVSGQSGAADEKNGLGAGGGSEGVKISSSEMANPDVKQALAQIQEQYGYPPAEFLDKLSKSKDVGAIFTSAPLNAMTSAEVAAAIKSSRAEALTAPAKASSLALAGPAEGPVSSASKPPESTGSMPPDNSLRDALTKRLSEGHAPEGEDDVDVSPEVKAALAAKAAQEREQADHESGATIELDLFQVVHRKYKEREKNIRWGEPLAAMMN